MKKSFCFQVLPSLIILAIALHLCLSFHLVVKDLGQNRQAAKKDTGNEQKLVNGKESQEVKIEPKDKFKQSFEPPGHLLWYSLSNSEQNAFDIFFRRFYT